MRNYEIKYNEIMETHFKGFEYDEPGKNQLNRIYKLLKCRDRFLEKLKSCYEEIESLKSETDGVFFEDLRNESLYNLLEETAEDIASEINHITRYARDIKKLDEEIKNIVEDLKMIKNEYDLYEVLGDEEIRAEVDIFEYVEAWEIQSTLHELNIFIEIYPMDQFDDYQSGVHPMDVARSIYYGKGFNPNDDYFAYDGYGNLYSATEDDYIETLRENTDGYEDEIVKTIVQIWGKDDILEYIEALELKIQEITGNDEAYINL